MTRPPRRGTGGGSAKGRGSGRGGPAGPRKRGSAPVPARRPGSGSGGSGARSAASAASIRRAPRGVGGEQVEGRQAVRELLLAGRRRVKEVLLATDLDPAPVIDDIVELATEARIPIRHLSRPKLDARAHTDAPQGVLAVAAPLPEADLDDLVQPVHGRPPFLVALDGVTDPGNLGAVLRSADGAGATGVVLPRHRAAHVTPAVTKAAAGAIEHLPIALVGGLPTALSRLRELGVWVVGLDGAADRTLWELDVAADAPICVVLGAEGRGLGRLVAQRCDQVVAIPMRGRLASLNVSTAGALALYEVARRRPG